MGDFVFFSYFRDSGVFGPVAGPQDRKPLLSVRPRAGAHAWTDVGGAEGLQADAYKLSLCVYIYITHVHPKGLNRLEQHPTLAERTLRH